VCGCTGPLAWLAVLNRIHGADDRVPHGPQHVFNHAENPPVILDDENGFGCRRRRRAGHRLLSGRPGGFIVRVRSSRPLLLPDRPTGRMNDMIHVTQGVVLALFATLWIGAIWKMWAAGLGQFEILRILVARFFATE